MTIRELVYELSKYSDDTETSVGEVSLSYVGRDNYRCVALLAVSPLEKSIVNDLVKRRKELALIQAHKRIDAG